MTDSFTQLHRYSPMLFWISLITFWLILLTGGYAGLSAAPWVPTRKRERNLLVKTLDIKPQDTIHDLGCGTGTILFALARKYKTAKFIGCEISIIPYVIAKIRSLFYKNVHIYYKNLFHQSIYAADIVIIFLLAKAYPKLKKKFKKELPASADVIIEGWVIDGVKPQKKIKTEKALPFYFYKGSDFK